jgi:hypothetical protein
MQKLMNNSLLFFLLFGAAAAGANCASKDCAADLDVTSLMQVQKNIKRGFERGSASDEAIASKAMVNAEESAPRYRQGSVQQSFDEGLELSHKFSKAAEKMEAGATRNLFEAFAICGSCNKFERWGEVNDGGYLVCMDKFEGGKVRGVYSMGVSDHDQWSADAAKFLQLKVDQYDCTVEHGTCPDCRFHKKCIVAADGSHHVPGMPKAQGLTLMEVLDQTGQADAAEGSLMLKMDIERSEWPIFAKESPETLKKFGQMVVEFHALHNVTQHPVYLKAMQNILASGLKVVHLHGNNDVGMVSAGDTTFPRVVEVTFVQGEPREGGCLKEQDYNAELDSPNWYNREELPMVHIGESDSDSTKLEPWGHKSYAEWKKAHAQEKTSA